MTLVGSPAPQFSLESTKSFDLDVPVALDDYRGRWLVLIFYPADFTFVCPTEILAFNNRAEDFAEANAGLVAISTDGVHCHEAWQEFVIGKLDFPLAADTTHEVTQKYGLLIENEGVARRASMIIDPVGTVRYEVIHDQDVGRSVDEIMRVLIALQAGASVPVNWVPGQETLGSFGRAA